MASMKTYVPDLEIIPRLFKSLLFVTSIARIHIVMVDCVLSRIILMNLRGKTSLLEQKVLMI